MRHPGRLSATARHCRRLSRAGRGQCSGPLDSLLAARRALSDSRGRMSVSTEQSPRTTAMTEPTPGDRRRAADRWPGCWSPTSPGSWPGPTPRCCSPTSAPRWSRSRARPATTPGPGSRRCATASRRTTSGVNRNKRSIALDLKDPDDVGRAQELAAARRRADRELQARRPGPVRPRLRDRRRGQPRRRLRLDQRLRQRPEGRRAARLRPDRAGDLRADEPDRRPRRASRTAPASRSST